MSLNNQSNTNSNLKQKIIFNPVSSTQINQNILFENISNSDTNIHSEDNNNNLGKTNLPINNISEILNEDNNLKEKLLKQILDIYKNNPDKLLVDLGPTDFAKVRFFIYLNYSIELSIIKFIQLNYRFRMF